MEINQMLLQSLIERLESEFRELEAQVAVHPTQDAREMDAFLGRKLRQVGMLRSMIASVDGDLAHPGIDLAVLRITFRQLKLELRFAQRKWKRLLLRETRLRKIEERFPHASPFAA